MPICGTTWRPTRIDRFIQSFGSSTKVVEVRTDAGLGFLKGMGNPQGSQALACELVATELAAWLGLQTLDIALVTVMPEDELPMADAAGYVQPGPAFISRKIQAASLDGRQVFLSRLARPADVAKLVVFDTWVMNSDRHAPQDAPIAPPPNRDNVIFTPVGRRRYALVAFDHTHCFTDGNLWENVDHIAIDGLGVYGLFPEFRPLIRKEYVQEAVGRLAQLDRETVATIVNAVPKEWGITSRVAAAWTDLIHRRARFVAEGVPFWLLGHGEMLV